MKDQILRLFSLGVTNKLLTPYTRPQMLGNCTGRRHLAFLKSYHRAAFLPWALPSPKLSCWQQFTQECPSAGSPSHFQLPCWPTKTSPWKSACLLLLLRFIKMRRKGRGSNRAGVPGQGRPAGLRAVLPRGKPAFLSHADKVHWPLAHLASKGLLQRECQAESDSLLPWADSLDLWLWASLTALHVSVHLYKMARHNKTQQQRGNMLYKSNTLF